ncbi:MAG: hypothetical protein ACTSUF_03555 [Candidatus Heimdallarchaeaceae archaeon]
MGNTIKLLVNKEVKAVSDIYPDMFSIERCEDFHIHWRNLRLIFNKKEFEKFYRAIKHAYNEWVYKGRPDPEPNKSLPDYLFSSKINPIHGRRPTDFRIEVQGDLPYMPKNMIHIHYKSLRLDVSHKEFIELAEAFTKALKEFKKWKRR